MLIQQILNSKSDDRVVTVAPGTSLAEAAALLSSRRIGAVVVSPDGKTIAGILSERDIVRELGKRGADCLSDSVDAVMTSDITSISRTATSDQALERMSAGRFRHLPVVEGGAMVGLISIGDVVQARLSELQHEKDALEGMIKGY